jgi:Secretion system C-terminal sorting domain
MKSFFQSAILAIAMCSAATASAQVGNGYYNTAIIASGGAFEFAPPFTDYVTVKKLNGNATNGLTPIGTIYTQSVQSVQSIGTFGKFAVAAEDSLVFFSTTLPQRLASFKIPDLYASLHSLYAPQNDGATTLWAGKWYGSNSDFLFYYNTNTFGGTTQYGGTVAGVNHDVRGMAQIGNTLYVSQNIQNVQYADSISYIIEVSATNKTVLGEFGRNNTDFLGISELFAYNDKLYGVCLGSNKIIERTPSAAANRVITLGSDNISKTLSCVGNRLMVVQNGIKCYDITTGQLIEDLTCLVPAGESVVAGIDGSNTGGAISNIFGTTDYTTYGRSYYQNNPCMANSTNVGIAPEAMAIVRSQLVHTQNEINNTLFGLSPNPTTDALNIRTNADISGGITIKIVDVLGRTLENTPYQAVPSQISLAYLPNGLYFVQIQTEKGLFIQKIEKM